MKNHHIKINNSNKVDFIKNVLSEKVLSETSESMLKEAISEVKSSMLAA